MKRLVSLLAFVMAMILCVNAMAAAQIMVVSGDFQMNVAETQEQWITDEIQAINAYVAAGQPVTTYFADVELKTTNDSTGTTPVVYETDAVLVAEYDVESGKQAVQIVPDISLLEIAPVDVLVGMLSEDKVVYTAVPATLESGIVTAVFDPETLAAMNDTETLLVVIGRIVSGSATNERVEIIHQDAPPSKQSKDLVIVTAGDSEGEEPFVIIVLSEEEYPEWAIDVMAAVAEKIMGGVSIVECFKEGVVAYAMPVGTNLDALTCYEAAVIEGVGYRDELGDVDASFVFPTEYTDEMSVGVVLIFEDESEYALKAEPLAGGVKVHFTADVLRRLNQTNGIVYFISDVK